MACHSIWKVSSSTRIKLHLKNEDPRSACVPVSCPFPNFGVIEVTQVPQDGHLNEVACLMQASGAKEGRAVG